MFPINKYVNDHGVGLLYEAGNVDTLRKAISSAKERSVDAFMKIFAAEKGIPVDAPI